MSPAYDYLCEKCDKSVELHLKVADRDRVNLCTSCGTAMKRVVVNDIRFRLLGTGWADTGYSSSVGDTREHLKGTGKTYKVDDDGNGRIE